MLNTPVFSKLILRLTQNRHQKLEEANTLQTKEFRMKKVFLALAICLAAVLVFASDYQLSVAKHSEYGDYLSGVDGKALYIFKNDVQGSGESTCYDACIAAWPAYLVDSPDYKSELPGDFSVITRKDGTYQLAYNGWPLYYFAGDTKAGDVNGQGVGDVWYVANYQAEVSSSY
jgi:predicted lipoprotein with Yx(FWY)xxD motif